VKGGEVVEYLGIETHSVHASQKETGVGKRLNIT
jgi:hypothetical protein